jgi:hypothetical protein
MKQNNNYKQDYVTSLLTGRIVGKEFLPNKLNPYPTLNELMRDKDLTKYEVLEKENLVLPLKTVNFETFKKSETEKKALKKAKSDYKKSSISDKERNEFLKLFNNRLPSWGDSSIVKIKLNFKLN